MKIIITNLIDRRSEEMIYHGDVVVRMLIKKLQKIFKWEFNFKSTRKYANFCGYNRVSAEKFLFQIGQTTLKICNRSWFNEMGQIKIIIFLLRQFNLFKIEIIYFLIVIKFIWKFIRLSNDSHWFTLNSESTATLDICGHWTHSVEKSAWNVIHSATLMVLFVRSHSRPRFVW